MWTFDNDSNGTFMVFDPNLPDDAPVVCRGVRKESDARLISAAPEMLTALAVAETVLERRAMSEADRRALAIVSGIIGKLTQTAD